MLDFNSFMVKTWYGEEKPVKKIVLFPERDQKGEVFYKIEGQLNLEYFMISYTYDKDKAIADFNKLLMELIDFQTNNLIAD